MRPVTTFVSLAFAFASQLGADEADPTVPGLAVGEKAPAFSLTDHLGASTELNSLLKKDRMLAVVFHRSADW
jgi:hypothetical protein